MKLARNPATGRPAILHETTVWRSNGTRLLSGFTLIELVVTLLLIGLLAAVAAPRFFSQQPFAERGFFEETLTAVRYAQKYAVASGCTVRVVTTANSYALFRAAALATCNTAPFATALANPVDPTQAFANTAPANVVLTPSDFTFAALGSASASVSIAVGGRSFQVIAATGLIQE